ncbi:MAG TPA: hypothetical protein VMM13_00925, partial [Euzebya sp.]|nr:hypothetical protein [Euzebya sp.]
VGLLRRRAEALTHCVALAVLGLATSLWHIAVQRIPEAGSTCDPLNPCSAIYVERFGFITIPVMAGSAFAVVLALAWAVRQTSITGTTDVHDTDSHDIETRDRVIYEENAQ